ncbi:MAG: DHA2 family efflux MFS transporter permease subunit [Rhodospirillaceae bacterium]|nr:MAG: DHA2 family efflux MFS transporter permease subunit [Rhodospirillaceae bacterium]
MITMAGRTTAERMRERWVLAATIIASSMAFIDMTIVNVALPILQENLRASFAEAQWVVEAYTLLLSALILAGGAIGDLYGRRRVFSLGICLFALSSAACGLAPEPMTLIIARAVQGIGAALMMPGSLAILSATFPPERQGQAIGLWSASTSICVAIAPAFGGWLIEISSWRWVFLINLPFAVIALAILHSRVPESRARHRHRLDWPGMVLGTLGLGCLTYGLIEGGHAGFGHPAVPATLALGVIALLAFIFTESRNLTPMVPMELFRRAGFAGIQAFTFCLWAALSGALFFVPFRLMQIQSFNPLQAGIALLPFVIIVSILSRWAGKLSDRLGPRLPLIVGALFAGCGFVWLAVPNAEANYLHGFMPALITIGIGMGICVAPVTVAAMQAAGSDRVGIASAINNMAARTGGLMAVAVFGLILAHRFGTVLDRTLAGLDLPPEALQALAAERAKLAAAHLPDMLTAAQQAAVSQAIKEAFVSGYRWAMAAAGLLAFLSAIIAAVSLRKMGNEAKAPLPPGGADFG